jgi:hypothetical protein
VKDHNFWYHNEIFFNLTNPFAMSLDGGYIALRGFRYQFDKTILAIFSQSADVTVEQLQDLGYDDYLVQVKYHDTNYDAAQQKARKKAPILQLIGEYQKDRTKKYVLFIYLKGIEASKQTLDLTALDGILGTAAATIAVKDRESFCKKFELVYSVDFQQQYQEVINTIMGSFKVKRDVAEIYYTMISSHLLQLVVDYPAPNVHKRVTNQASLNHLIAKNQRVIFRSHYAQELGREKYCQWIKKTYFKSGLNREAYERLFIIEVGHDSTIQQLKDLLLHIKGRWSHNGRASIPDKERFAPYVFFRNVKDNDLAVLKQQLSAEGFKIKDGHDYKRADFDVHSLMEMPNYYNKIFFKIINDELALNEVIGVHSRTKELYQFYLTNPANLNYPALKQIQIEVENITEIINII